MEFWTDLWYTELTRFFERVIIMGLLPMDADILPPSDDRVFKLILTPQESKPILIDLISSIIKRPVVGVEVRNNEIDRKSVV